MVHYGVWLWLAWVNGLIILLIFMSLSKLMSHCDIHQAFCLIVTFIKWFSLDFIKDDVTLQQLSRLLSHRNIFLGLFWITTFQNGYVGL